MGVISACRAADIETVRVSGHAGFQSVVHKPHGTEYN